ncbi:hypothetical protein EVAR_85674_1 [Eumeta japonica]|uniref:Uncharacterized protein n=1 Tax=Eumeta variegata TaxID=151549 RepID=A0A4C1WAJ5_EUMVA|nr:hypothetical protein EVAR_85674_1 [Eumeta japonica]
MFKKFQKKRQALTKDVIKNPILKQQLNRHEKVGRPRLEKAQPELLKILAEIAIFGGGADKKRRIEMTFFLSQDDKKHIPIGKTAVKKQAPFCDAYGISSATTRSRLGGRSCFNRVERRMAPLSHQLSGLVLPYDSFGNHLDDQHYAMDDELRNFKIAGDILA